MDKLFERENRNSNFHCFFLEVQNNQYTFLNLRYLYILVIWSVMILYHKFSFLFIAKRLAKRLITDVKRRRQLSRQVAPATATADALTQADAKH